MSFGIQNLGVINQKNAPAIWESDIVDFPANFIFGRILIDNVNGGIYIDLLSSRKQIVANNLGELTAHNGLNITELVNGKVVGLGGQLNQETTLEINGQNLNIYGTSIENKFDSLGVFLNLNNGVDYMPIDEDGAVSVPNTSINIYNLRTGNFYRVAVQKF